MSPKPARTATANASLLAASLLAATLLPSAQASAWPFGAKPAASPAAASAAPAKTAPTDKPQKATLAQRAAADRLDPLSRSAFWAHEVEADPTDAQAGVELATALRMLGRYQEAVQAAERVRVLEPRNFEALMETARAYIGADKGFYAIEPLKEAEATAPKDWRPVSLMGVAREQNQQPEEARAAFLQALQLSPENPAVLSNLALWYATHGDHAQAETLLRRAAVQPAASAQVRQDLALVLGMEGKFGPAEQLMREDLPPEVANNNLAYLKTVSGIVR